MPTTEYHIVTGGLAGRPETYIVTQGDPNPVSPVFPTIFALLVWMRDHAWVNDSVDDDGGVHPYRVLPTPGNSLYPTLDWPCPEIDPADLKGIPAPEDASYWGQWHASSGHPGGWRVTRGLSPVEELEGKTGKLILFRSCAAAQKRADELNTPDPNENAIDEMISDCADEYSNDVEIQKLGDLATDLWSHLTRDQRAAYITGRASEPPREYRSF